ncbi:MAG: tetratricopeptide repeat protein [Candidatus Omnitrophica bacterium]|nr:tetratricopeptide repeat protein [Candidatus Omnitrophota bacterium]
MKTVKKILGMVIILVGIWSLWPYLGDALWGIAGGAEDMLATIVAIILFLLNVGLILVGVQIFMNKIKVYTYVFLILGLIALVPFYKQLYLEYMSPMRKVARGDVEGALKECTRIIDSEEKGSAYVMRGRIYYGLGEYKKALSDFAAVDGWIKYKYAIFTHIRLNDFESALRTCDAWARVMPRLASVAYCYKGDLYYAQGDYENAIEAYRKHIELSKIPNDDRSWVEDGAKVEDYIRLSTCYAKLGNFSLAEEYLDRAFTLASDFNKDLSINESADLTSVLVARGNLYAYIGKLDEAKAQYRQAVQRNDSKFTQRVICKKASSKILKEMGVQCYLNALDEKKERDPSRAIDRDMRDLMPSFPSYKWICR